MIVRWSLECANCEKVTILRIGIGGKEQETVQFECENCAQEINVLLRLDQVNVEIKGLDVDGARIVDTEEFDYVFTFHPNFPGSSSPLGKEFESPFLAAYARHGNDLLSKSARPVMLNKVVSESGKDISRIIHNYLRGDWEHFRKSIREYLPKDWDLDAPVDRNRALYQVLELVLMPLVSSEAHVRLIQFFSQYVSQLSVQHSTAMRAFLDEVEGEQIVGSVQRDALVLVPRILKLTDDLSQILHEWEPETPDAEVSETLTASGKSNFDLLKSFYVDAYELTCRSLTLVMGLINIERRGDCNVFPPHPGSKKAKPLASDLRAFHKQAHAPKLELLAEHPDFQNWLSSSLEPKLRNAIGHNTISYKPAAGKVSYPLDKQGENWVSITYANFLIRILRVFLRSHQANHLVKVLFVVKYFDAR